MAIVAVNGVGFNPFTSNARDINSLLKLVFESVVDLDDIHAAHGAAGHRLDRRGQRVHLYAARGRPLPQRRGADRLRRVLEL